MGQEKGKKKSLLAYISKFPALKVEFKDGEG